MDAAFQLDGDARTNFIRVLVQTTGCSYICFWSWLAPSRCLLSLDGLFYEATTPTTQPSSSSGSVAQRLFEEYRTSVIVVHDNHGSFPGFAFKNSHTFIELTEENLTSLSTSQAQRDFYRAARIKKAIFMGCRSGEIELGFSNMPPDIDAETSLRSLFWEDFSSRQASIQELPRLIEQQLNPPTSSASSWRSLSLDSPECSSMLFNIPGSSFLPNSIREVTPTIDAQAVSMQPLTTTVPSMTDVPEQLQALQVLARLSNSRFPIPGDEHEAMTRAFLAVMTSPSSSTSSSQQQNIPWASNNPANPGNGGAFRRYSSSALTPTQAAQMKLSSRRCDNLMKRSIAYFRNLNHMRVRQQRMQPATMSRPTSTQLHHMMSERKRREKLNESLQALKALLPPGTKKDKATVLATTRDYLTSLQAQIEELRQRNAALEARLQTTNNAKPEERGDDIPTNGDPINVRVHQPQESTPQNRTINLQVIVRRSECTCTQLVIRILEFLRRLHNIQLLSMDADTRETATGTIDRVNLRLKVEGDEWDESAFQEAVRRVVADVARRQI